MKSITSHHLHAALTSPNRICALRTAYRHLYREGLKCIRYATPGRYQLRDSLRKGFRKGKPEEFEPSRVINTLEFFNRAQQLVGTEHHIIKNVLHVRYWQQPLHRRETYRMFENEGKNPELKKAAYEQFEQLIHQLNESLYLCLR